MDALQTIGASFAPLRIRNLRIYLIGQTVSTIGTYLHVTAYGWVVWQLTQSTVGLGAAAMLYSLPFLLVGPFASGWADRVDRRKLRLATQTASMLIAFTLAALVLTQSIQVWHIFVFSVVMGIMSAIDAPSAQAFLGDLSGVTMVRQAVNLYLLLVQTSRILGPAIGAVVLSVWGAGAAFILNGFSFLAIIASLLIVRAEQVHKPAKEHESFREAIQYVRSEPRLADCVLFAILATFFGFSIILNMLPAVADTLLGGDASTYGILMGASGVGSLVSMLIVVPLMQAQKRVGAVLAGAMLIGAVFLFLLGATNAIPLAIAALFVSGLALPAVMTTIMGILQVNAPPNMRGRMVGVFLLVSYGLQPFAALWVGGVGNLIGIQAAIMVNAVLMILGTVALVSRAPLRQWQETQIDLLPEPSSAGD